MLIPEMVGELHDELHYLREQLNLELERRSAEAKSFQQTIRALTSANASLTERLRALEPPQGMPSVNQDVATDGAGDDSDEGPPDAEWSTFVLPSVEWLAFVAPIGPSVAAILFEVSLWGLRSCSDGSTLRPPLLCFLPFLGSHTGATVKRVPESGALYESAR